MRAPSIVADPEPVPIRPLPTATSAPGELVDSVTRTDVASAIVRALHATSRRPRLPRHIYTTPRDQWVRPHGHGPPTIRTLGTKLNHSEAGGPAKPLAKGRTRRKPELV